MHHVKRKGFGYLLFIGMLIKTSPLFAAAAATVELVWGTASAVSIAGAAFRISGECLLVQR